MQSPSTAPILEEGLALDLGHIAQECTKVLHFEIRLLFFM